MVAKLILAAIVPGGFLVWGIYEFKRRKEQTNGQQRKEDILRDIRADVDDA